MGLYYPDIMHMKNDAIGGIHIHCHTFSMEASCHRKCVYGKWAPLKITSPKSKSGLYKLNRTVKKLWQLYCHSFFFMAADIDPQLVKSCTIPLKSYSQRSRLSLKFK
jgi:hypothetical protein